MEKLIGVGDLFKNTWKIYREKFALLVGLMALPFLLMALNQVLMSLGKGIIITLGSLINIVVSIGVIWALAGILLVLSNNQVLTVKEAYRLSRGKLLSYLWVSILAMFIAGGGFMLFVIPGIILSVWLAFAQIISVVEGEKGLRAIVKSREYVRDYFWPILGRFLLLSVILFVVYFILMAIAGFVASLFSSFGSTVFVLVLSLLGSAINFLFVPLGVIYAYLLYGNVKQVKGEVLIDPAKKQGLRYLLVGLAGWVLIAVVSIFLLSLLVSLFAGLFFGQALSGMNSGAINELPRVIPKIPTEMPAGLTAEQQQQLQTQLDAMKKLQDKLNIPTE